MKFFFRNLFVLSIVFLPLCTLAQTSSSPGGSPTSGSGININPAVGFNIPSPINVYTVCGLVQKILSFGLAVGMPIAALFLAWAGFSFILARGKPAELLKAKSNLWHVLLGVFIFMAAWLLGQVIANTIKSIAPPPSGPGSISSCN